MRRWKLSSTETSWALASVDPLFAAIDLGSHTIRLIIAACRDRKVLLPRRLERRVTRLARGFDARACLEPAGMHASIAVLREYAELIRRLGSPSVICGATGVVRRAHNSTAFLEAIAQETTISGTILSEEREATLSLKGVLAGLPRRTRPVLAFDLGGSSTELTLAHPDHPEPTWVISLMLGAATLTADYLSADPPPQDALPRAAEAVRQVLQPAFAQLGRHLGRLGLSPAELEVVGTAGTVTTLAAMVLQMTEYLPYRVNGLKLEARWIDDTIARLGPLTLAQRRKLPGLEKDREDIILGGALIVREILRGLRQEALVVTDAGLLEGLLLSSVESAFGWPESLTTPLTWGCQQEQERGRSV
jgi:exopolyphosphatase / guanosine-5'-triphosphate,3'-diphosphate pyrophosphatase